MGVGNGVPRVVVVERTSCCCREYLAGVCCREYLAGVCGREYLAGVCYREYLAVAHSCLLKYFFAAFVVIRLQSLRPCLLMRDYRSQESTLQLASAPGLKHGGRSR